MVIDSDFVDQVLAKHVQIVDCRAPDAFLGLDASKEVAGHFESAWNVPFQSLFALESDGSALLSLNELHQVLATDAGVDLSTPVAVISSDVSEAALVATCLLLAGHASVSLCLSPLTDELVAKTPTEFTSGIFYVDQLVYASETGAFDLSPSATGSGVDESATSVDGKSAKELTDAYAERLSGKHQATNNSDKEETERDARTQEVVWVADGKRFFDMPAPITKAVFLDASLAILRVVSFVLAPYGFPVSLRDRFSLAEVKTHFGSLFQDVIEVCSDFVYSLKGLNEGAMAMSVHKWVEEKRDADCSARVREINDLWSVLYQVPTVVEVPDVPDDHVVSLASKLKLKLDAAVHKRAAWALDAPSPNDSANDDNDDDVAQRKVSAGWQSMYPGVVYALGFIPREPAESHKKLSTLQIKSLIQAIAEATWDVIGDEKLSQMEFQALCDTVTQDDDKAAIDAITRAAEQSLYVAKHFLTRTVPKDDGYASVMSAVRSAVDDGHRQLRANRPQTALAAFASAFAHLPMFHKDLEKAMVGRANCLVQLQQLELARTQAEVALRLNPFSADAYASLGHINELQQTRPEAAMQHFVTAFILDGSRSTEHAEAIDRVSRVVGRRVAKDVFRRMVQVHDLPSPWLTQSYFDAFEHDVDNGAKVPFDIAKHVGVASTALAPETLLYRAIHLKRQQQFDEAQRDICTLIETTADATADGLSTDLQAVALNLHASFLYVAGDVHAALDAIAASLALKPSLVNSLVKKGGFLSELGETAAATECFEAAIALDPNDADVYLHMGQMELLDGRYANAVQSLRRAMSRSEALAVTHVSYGMALYKCGSIYQANDVFEDAVKAFPHSPEVHLFQGEVLADQGNYADAMKHFLEAFELSPACPLPFLNAGRVYVSTNDPMRAIAHFEHALAIDPRCSSAHLDIAQVLFAQGRTDEAFAHFDTAATCCRFLPEVEEVCASRAMAKMQLQVTEILGVELRHIMRSK